jgi:hypothetical protein
MAEGRGRKANRAPAGSADRARGVLTRINAEGLKGLRQLALDRDTTLQALMIEAANDLLRKYRRKGVAETPPRSLIPKSSGKDV